MKPSDALDTSDLRRLFLFTAAMSAVVTLCAAPFSIDWAGRYGLIAGLALINWYALAQIIVGAFTSNIRALATGIFLKPVMLGGFLLYAMKLGIEISSFLAGLNTFFVCLLVLLLAKKLPGFASFKGLMHGT